MTTDDAEAILIAGSNLIINVRPTDDLVRLASTALLHKVQLTIVGGMNPDSRRTVATAGGKHVTFDVARYPVKEVAARHPTDE